MKTDESDSREVRKTLEDEELDRRHSKKRILSFERLEECLNACAAGHCPNISPRDVPYLTDISIEGYYDQRAYYYYIDGIGVHDTERYHMAAEKVNRVLDCGLEPELSSDAFLVDIASLCHDMDTYHGARKRRAFWTFRKFYPINNPDTDYCGACGFVEKMLGACAIADAQALRDLIEKNSHVATGLDVFRHCVLRRAQRSAGRRGGNGNGRRNA